MDLEEAKLLMRKMVTAFAEKVAPLYQILGWKWETKGGQPYIPSKEQIEEALIELIDGLLPGYTAHAAGGLEVYFEQPDKDDCGHFGLRFIEEEDTAF